MTFFYTLPVDYPAGSTATVSYPYLPTNSTVISTPTADPEPSSIWVLDGDPYIVGQREKLKTYQGRREMFGDKVMNRRLFRLREEVNKWFDLTKVIRPNDFYRALEKPSFIARQLHKEHRVKIREPGKRARKKPTVKFNPRSRLPRKFKRIK